MKFDTLCSIVLEGKKQAQFSRISVVNSEPTFSLDDVLRDPSDPAKGVKSYLEDTRTEDESGEPIDEERKARRVLRRLNWVARSVIKRTGSRELNLRKLHLDIIIMIEKYLTNVLGHDQEQVDSMELKIAKEAALIGNLLLPPSTRNPNAKGVFSIVTTSLPKEVKMEKGDKSFKVADRLSQEFNMNVEEYIAAFDPDLIGTIKEIIRTGAKNKSKSVEPSYEAEVDEVDDAAVQESFDMGEEGVDVGDLLKDPRIKNIYDSRVVRKTLRSLIDMGSIMMNPDGKLVLPEPGAEGWRKGMDKAKEAGALEKLEDFPEDQDIEDLAQTFGDDSETDVAPEDEEDEENWTGDQGHSGIAATRLGYKKPSREVDDTDEAIDDDDETKW